MVEISLKSIRQLRLLIVGALMLLTVEIGNQAGAESYHRGIVEYEVACMSCHGIVGRGDGPLAKTLKTPPADLTKIAKSNKGEFPTARIAEIIDGRAIVAVHGKREMPVWGDRYSVAMEGESPAMVEKRVRVQIDALIDYLKSLQD
jgi:mono/diheme cytochrome c family protein